MSSSKKFYVHFVTSIKLLAAACISLSVKSNGENIELDAIIITFFCMLQHTRRSTLDEEFKKIKDSLIKMECIILRMIDFDLNHRLAHELLIYFLFDIHQELESVNMWYVIFELCSKISSDFYLSNKCLNYKPEELASSSIQAAFYIAGMDIDTSPYMKTWLQNTTIEIAPAAKSKSFSIDKEKTTDPLIRKRVPENAEGVAVLVGQLPELEKPASTFVRLAEGKLIQHFLEVDQMLIYIPKSRSKSPDLLTKDWPTVCTFKKDHNHGIETAAVLKCRDLSEASKETLKLLFRKGHNPSSALHCLKTDLLLEHGEEFYKIDADGYYVPSLSVVSKLFQREFSDIYGGMTGPEMFKGLKKLLADYTSASSGKAEFHRTEDGQYYFVVILTPIMLRVHEHIVQSKELILIDASGGMDKQRHRIYFFVCPTSAGGLPAGVIISDTEKESVFYEALVCYKSMLGNVAFFGETFPKVFLTDNDLKERKPLAKLFPQSKLLLCQFHFLKSVWSWLCNKHNSVKDTERQELYFFVKNMVYVNNEEEFFKCREEMVSSDVFKNNKNFWHYFDFLWSQKSDWALCYRKHLPVRGNNTTNYVEVVFGIIKDNILNRVMAFNINQLVDFILTRYEMYMQKRLIDFVNGRLSKSLLYKMQPVENDIHNEDIHPNGNYLFTVRNQNKDHLVDLLNGVCSCSTEQSGKICKHASAVIMHSTNEIITAYNLACPSMKQKFFLVATGNSVSPDWLMPLNQQPAVDTIEFSETKKNLQPSRNSNMEEMSIASPSTSGALNYTPENETSSADDLVEFDALVARMKEGYQNEPDVFVPAMKKMLKNARTNATTQTGLVSAMHTFGLYSGAGRRINRERHHGQRIGVQPTSINRRKIILAGKRKLSAGRPVQSAKVSKELQSHDYTSFGSLPSRKLKATHNLQDCVYNNKSLGGRK